MQKLNVNKRVFAYLVDTVSTGLIGFFAGYAANLLWQNDIVAGLVGAGAFLFRDAFSKTGSLGKLTAGLHLEIPNPSIANRLKISFFRNWHLEFFTFAAYLPLGASAEKLFMFLGLIVVLVEYIKLRRNNGIRFGDQFAKTSVTDLAPAESGKKYFVYSLLLICVVIAGLLFISRDEISKAINDRPSQT